MSKTRRWVAGSSNGGIISALINEQNYNYKVVSLALRLSAVPVNSSFFVVTRTRPVGSVFLSIWLANIDMATCNLSQWLSNEHFECLARDSVSAVYVNPDGLIGQTEIIIERI